MVYFGIFICVKKKKTDTTSVPFLEDDDWEDEE